MAKLVNKILFVKHITILSTYLLIIWAFYRFLFQFPTEIEELIIKPIVWLAPIFYFLKKEKLGFYSIGLTFKKFFPSIYFSLALGAVFVGEAVLINYAKYHGLNFQANTGLIPLMPSLGISFVTALSEELTFRGYIFNRLLLVLKNEVLANVIQTLLWTAIHVPIAFFVLKLDVTSGIVYLFLTAMFGFGSAFIFNKTKNVFGSIVLHVLWEWPIILFR